MTIAAVRERSAAPDARAAVDGRRPRRLEWGTVLCGAALAVLVATDGTAAWQVVRGLFIATVAAGAVLAETRSSPSWRSRVAVLVGMPTLAVAVGFSPYLVKGGPLLVRASTVLLAIAAAGLTVGGTVAATRGRRLPHRLAGGAAVAAVTALTMFVTSPAVAATNVPRPDIDATPAGTGLAVEDVALRTDDGVPLAGWYVESENGAAVVLLHGAGSTRSAVLAHAAVLASAGFGVLMVDARGHGDSGGRAMDFGWHGDDDIAAATAFLAARPDVDAARIGAVGLSMGGEEAIGASATNRLLRAVVAEGATARAASDEAWLSDRYGIRGAVQEQLERLQDRITDVLTEASVPTSLRAATAASGPTRYLLITAGNEPDEGHAAEYIAAAAPDRVATWTVEGAAHTGGLEVAPDAWSDRVVAFLADVLLAPAR